MAEFKEDPELMGNIKLESDRPVRIEVADDNEHGFRTTDDQVSTAAASTAPNRRSTMNTLDEPVSETIVSLSQANPQSIEKRFAKNLVET
jgi:hypothetical protein